MKSTTLPFEGFYESLCDSEIDRAFEMIFDYDGDGEIDVPADKIEAFWDDYNPYKWGFREAYCKEYVNFISDLINVKLKFDALDSPKFYNFSTDRIFAKIALKDIKNMFKEVDKDIFAKRIKDQFTPRSGFIPSYSDNYDDWIKKPLKDYDHNEVGTLLEAFIITKESEEYFELLHGHAADYINCYELISCLVPKEFYDKYYQEESVA